VTENHQQRDADGDEADDHEVREQDGHRPPEGL